MVRNEYGLTPLWRQGARATATPRSSHPEESELDELVAHDVRRKRAVVPEDKESMSKQKNRANKRNEERHT